MQTTFGRVKKEGRRGLDIGSIPCLENTIVLENDIYNSSISTSMLASILCVKKACLDHVLELKIDNIRFAGYAKEVQSNYII